MSFEAITQMAKAKKPEKTEKTQEELRQALLERREVLRRSTLERVDIYDEKLEKGEFDDQAGEPAGSGEKRKLQMQAELLRADKQIDKMTEALDSGEELSPEPIPDLASLNAQNQAPLEIFGKPKNKFVPTLVRPEDQDYTVLKDDTDSGKFGEYTLNPDTQNLDFENILESKIFVPDLSALEGRPLSEVAKYLMDTYSATHKIPGVEYWKWLSENPAKSPKKIQDGKYYFEFGSLVRYSDGDWCVPCACWNGADWNRNANGLGSSWSSSSRVVLLEI